MYERMYDRHDVCEWVAGWWCSRTTSAHIQTHARSLVSNSILEYLTKLCANMFQIFRLKAKLVFESKSTRMKKKKLNLYTDLRCIALQCIELLAIRFYIACKHCSTLKITAPNDVKRLFEREREKEIEKSNNIEQFSWASTLNTLLWAAAEYLDIIT